MFLIDICTIIFSWIIYFLSWCFRKISNICYWTYDDTFQPKHQGYIMQWIHRNDSIVCSYCTFYEASQEQALIAMNQRIETTIESNSNVLYRIVANNTNIHKLTDENKFEYSQKLVMEAKSQLKEYFRLKLQTIEEHITQQWLCEIVLVYWKKRLWNWCCWLKLHYLLTKIRLFQFEQVRTMLCTYFYYIKEPSMLRQFLRVMRRFEPCLHVSDAKAWYKICSYQENVPSCFEECYNILEEEFPAIQADVWNQMVMATHEAFSYRFRDNAKIKLQHVMQQPGVHEQCIAYVCKEQRMKWCKYNFGCMQEYFHPIFQALQYPDERIIRCLEQQYREQTSLCLCTTDDIKQIQRLIQYYCSIFSTHITSTRGYVKKRILHHTKSKQVQSEMWLYLFEHMKQEQIKLEYQQECGILSEHLQTLPDVLIDIVCDYL